MTVKLVPYIHRTTKEILEAFKQGHKTDKKAKSFTFKGVEFFYAEQQTCYALLTSVDDPLPKVFTDNTLRLKHIEINHDKPDNCAISATLNLNSSRRIRKGCFAMVDPSTCSKIKTLLY